MDKEEKSELVSESTETGFNVRPAKMNKTDEIYVYYRSDDEPVNDDISLDDDSDFPVEPPVFREETASSAESSQQTELPEREAPAADPAPAVESPKPQPSVFVSEQPEHCESERSLKLSKMLMVSIVISMITLCVVAAAVFVCFAYMKSVERYLRLDISKISDLETSIERMNAQRVTDDEDAVETASLLDNEDSKEESAESGGTVGIENGKLLLYDHSVGYSWVPVLTGIKQCEYDRESFSFNEDHRMEYRTGNEVSSYFGIDVSSHQGDIDWVAARDDGVEFAFLRIGVRGYGPEGNIKADDCFFKNYDAAHDAGVDLGVYFYSQAVSVEEAQEEADFVLELLGGKTLEYPVVFDWEPVDASSTDITPRTEDVMPETLTLCAIAFCERIKEGGYSPMLYTNKKLAYIKYDMRQLGNYPVWLALYSDELTYYYDFDIWQYGTGDVDGIEGPVDLNIAVIR